MTTLKSPRTPHLIGSGIPTSGEHKERIDWKSLIDRFIVLEEKIDGSEVSFHFNGDATLIGRERANILDLNRRGGVEAHLDHFKDFLHENAETVLERIEDRYLVYAEWCAITHTIFYNALPSYFIECDVQDKHTGLFLSTARRRELFAGLPIVQAPVLFAGRATVSMPPTDFLGQSAYADNATSDDWHNERLRAGLAADNRSVDLSGRSEGVYGKIEDANHVLGRFKFVREDFVRKIVDDPTHWKKRQPVRNVLKER
jgi:hypothetical protein